MHLRYAGLILWGVLWMRVAILVLILECVWFPVLRAQWTNTEFRIVMKEWAQGLSDPNNRISRWKDVRRIEVCEFEGVNCLDDDDYDDDPILEVSLNGFGLTGSIPGWIWSLPERNLDLGGNTWIGSPNVFEDTGKRLVQTISCTDCNWYYKAEEGEAVLPKEFTLFQFLKEIDIRNNSNLIGAFPPEWTRLHLLSKRSGVLLASSGICGVNPFYEIETQARIELELTEAVAQCRELTQPPPPPVPLR